MVIGNQLLQPDGHPDDRVSPQVGGRFGGDSVAPLSVTDLGVSYSRTPVLWKINYEVPQNGLTAIIGPNGAGKSTFIKACLGLVPVISGSVRVFGKPLSEQRQLVSYMPQRSTLDWDFPVSALDVVTMGRYRKIGLFRSVKKRDHEFARAALDRVGLSSFANRPIGQLSGGQQQRVLLARALTQDAQLYFMDEPFAGVDAATESAMFDVLHSLDEEGKTVVCVHHDLQTVAENFQNILLLNARKVAAGPVNETLTRENLQQAYGGKLRGLASIAVDGSGLIRPEFPIH